MTELLENSPVSAGEDDVRQYLNEIRLGNAYNELKAMNEKYTAGSQIKMKMELVK